MSTYLKQSLTEYDQDADKLIVKHFKKQANYFLQNLDARNYFVSQLMWADNKYDPSKGLTQDEYRLYFMRLKVKEYWRSHGKKRRFEQLVDVSVDEDECSEKEELNTNKEKVRHLLALLKPEQKRAIESYLKTNNVSETARQLNKSIYIANTLIKSSINYLKRLFMFNLKLAVVLYSQENGKTQVFLKNGRIPTIDVSKDINQTLLDNFKPIFGFDPQWVQYNFSGVVEDEDNLYLVLPIFSPKVTGEYGTEFSGIDQEFIKSAFIS